MKQNFIFYLCKILKLDEEEMLSIAQKYDEYEASSVDARKRFKDFGDMTKKGAIATAITRMTVDSPLILLLFVLAVITTPFRIIFHLLGV